MATQSPYLATNAAPGTIRPPGSQNYLSTPDTANMLGTARSDRTGATSPTTPNANSNFLPGFQPGWSTAAGANRPFSAPTPKPAQTTSEMNPAQLQNYYQQVMNKDPTWIGEQGRNFDQLQMAYQGGYITPAVQALTQWGGTLPDEIMKQLQGNAPTFSAAGQEFSLGPSLGQALAGTDQAAAARNPYSIVNQLAHNQNLANASSIGNLQSRGLGHSGGVQSAFLSNEYNAGLARQAQVNQLLSGITGLQSGFRDQMLNAADIQETSTNNALQRIIQQISTGQLGIPSVTTNRPTTPGVVPGVGQNVAGPGGGYFQPGRGTYGAKPLY